MKKLILILVMLFLFVASFGSVNANYYWRQEANAGYQGVSLGGYNSIGFGSNYKNGVSVTNGTNLTYSYAKCDVLGSDFSPVAFDFDGDGVLEVVLTDIDLQKIYIYDTSCNLEGMISLEDEEIQDMPVLFDEDLSSDCVDTSDEGNPVFVYSSNYNPKIIVLTNRSLKMIDYSSGTYGITKSIDYLSETSDEVLNYLMCREQWLGEMCFGYKVSEVSSSDGTLEKVVYFDFGTELANLYLQDYDTEESASYLYGSLTSFPHPLNTALYLMPFGLTSEQNVGDKSALLDSFGDFEYSYELGWPAGHIFRKYYDSVHYIARIGTGYYIVSYNMLTDYDGAGPYISREFINVHELFTGNSVFRLTSGLSITSSVRDIDKRVYSNPVVADFDKDGLNEFALLINSSDGINLVVYEEGFEVNQTVDYTSVMTDINNMVMGDFYVSSDLCLATVEGIFCDGYKYFDTGENSDWSYPIIAFKDLTVNKSLFYLSSEKGFIVGVNLTAEICGDGICQPWENDFNCPEDCINETIEEPDEEEGDYREGSHCETDDDCADGLRCEYGVCTLLTFGYKCTLDSDCLSGECLNGYCTKASWWEKMEASKSQQFGDSSNTNNFIALFFMIAIAGFLGYYGNIWMGVGSLYITGIFFTIVGWLSVFILFGLILTGIIAVVFKLTMGSGQG